MVRIRLLMTLFFILPFLARSQDKVDLNIYVFSKEGESVMNSHLKIGEDIRKIGNQYGFVACKLEKGTHLLEVSHISYQSEFIEIELIRDTTISVFLENISFEIIDIYSSRSNNIEQLEDIRIKDFKDIPGITGTADILNTITLLPGVSQGKEGEIGFSARGGEPYQNSILLDRSIVLNPNHLFGFLSTINSKIINDVKFYKNHIPSRFGNASASIIDIDVKSGNKDSLKYDLDLGLTNSSLLINGPLSDKITFSAGGRATYLGILLSPLYIQYLRGTRNFYGNYNFYDYNLKVKYEISPSDKITFHVYRSRDNVIGKNQVFQESMGERSYGWQNQSYNLSYAKHYSNGLFWNNYLNFSAYNNKLRSKTEENISSDMPQISISTRRSDYRIYSFQSQVSKSITSKSLLRVGINAEYTQFDPFAFTFEDNDGINSLSSFEYGLANMSLYFDNDYDIASTLKFNYGIRYNLYINQSIREGVIEPRVSVRKQLGVNSFIEASYNRLSQNRIQFSLKNYAFPLELNIPIGDKVRPPLTQQLGLSFVKNRMYQSSVNALFSVYYKRLDNLTTVDKVVPFTNSFDENFEKYLSFNGKGEAYGFEASLSYSSEVHSIICNYHLSRSFRRYETINDGSWFPHEFDRPHELSLIYQYEPSAKNSIYFNFTLNSGHITTLPSGVVEVNDDINFYFFSDRNNYRLPFYHRLDIAYSRKLATKFKRPATITFALYNAYYSRNAYDVVVFRNLDTGNYELKRLAVFPIIPSVNYSIKF